MGSTQSKSIAVSETIFSRRRPSTPLAGVAVSASAESASPKVRTICRATSMALMIRRIKSDRFHRAADLAGTETSTALWWWRAPAGHFLSNL